MERVQLMHLYSLTLFNSMKKVYLYCDPRSLNEATVYYNNIVKRGIQESLGDVDFKVVHSLKEIKNPDCIYTITHHFFVLAKLRFPFSKTICWFQGIGYEEAKMTRARWKWYLFMLEEWLTVHLADYILFVSQKMKDYYSQKYGYKGSNYTIMPCYNLRQSDVFDVQQYQKPTFAYAGGLNKWQSVDVLLDVFSIVEKKIKDAKLTLYCKSTPELQKMLEERGITNCEVLFVPLEKLQDELHKHKYGFILREKNWVNLVATPTKMNSYLASYMIPIFSDGVDDFVKNIKLGEFTICASTPLKPKEVANMITQFEDNEHNFEGLKIQVDEVFNNHYNDETYINLISNKIKALLRL